MYCQKCGKEIESDSRFCFSCGAPKGGVLQSVNLESPVMKMKPKFIPALALSVIMPINVFLTIWATIFFGGIGMAAFNAVGMGLPDGVTFAIAGVLFFFFFPALVYFVQKKSYSKTEYRFFSDKLEYYEGFFNIEEKSIKYKNVTEVYLRKGVFQKMYGLGTIVFSTPATGTQSVNRSRSGIKVLDIENSDEVYRQIKDLVEKAS
ncbi:MAG: PH domain-containing protein [Elusimicrobiota bacterium]|nr:PH domain-containing protein [Elusimicrobiota bacterium]